MDSIPNKIITPSEKEFAIAKLFKTENGQKVLDILRDMTVNRPIFEQLASEGVNTAILMAIREGENNLYRRILLIIKKVDSYGNRKSK